jgi:transcription elongation factor GreA-like protein
LTGGIGNVQLFNTAVKHLLPLQECNTAVKRLGSILSLETLLATPVQSLRVLLEHGALEDAKELLRDTVEAVLATKTWQLAGSSVPK